MQTQINGKEAEWSDVIRAKWYAVFITPLHDIVSANYFTLRPCVDERGRRAHEEGFTYLKRARYPGGSLRGEAIIRRQVYQST